MTTIFGPTNNLNLYANQGDDFSYNFQVVDIYNNVVDLTNYTISAIFNNLSKLNPVTYQFVSTITDAINGCFTLSLTPAASQNQYTTLEGTVSTGNITGIVNYVGNLVYGTLYPTALNVPVTGGTGTGLTLDIIAAVSGTPPVNGPVVSVTINQPGSGYSIGDTVVIDSGSGDATVQVITTTQLTTDNVIGSGTNFRRVLVAGQNVQIQNQIVEIQLVNSDTELTICTPLSPATVSNVTIAAQNPVLTNFQYPYTITITDTTPIITRIFQGSIEFN